MTDFQFAHPMLSHENAVNMTNIPVYLGCDTIGRTNDGLLFIPRISNLPSHWCNLDSDSHTQGRL